MLSTGCYHSPQFQDSYCSNDNLQRSLQLQCSSSVSTASFPECQLQSSSTHPDTYPPESYALSQSNKMNNNYVYSSNALYDIPLQNEHFVPTQCLQQFKVPGTASIADCRSDTKLCISPLNDGSASVSSYRTGPGTNNVRVRTVDKYRTVYSSHQKLELEKEFSICQFINSERKARLSTTLKLTERQVKIWFQNRRAKERRQQKRRHLNVSMEE